MNKKLSDYSLTKSQLQLIEAATAIFQTPEDEREIAFLARQLIQATLPHRNPPGNPPEWFRTNGDLTLSIRPAYRTDPHSKERVCVGYPYGSIPRLLLFWITTEAIRTGNRKLELGASLKAFMETIGLSTKTGGGKRSNVIGLKNQMERLFKASISFEYSTDAQTSWLDMNVAPKGQLWFDPTDPEQDTLFDSWIELGESFFDSITSAPVPLDMEAIRALKRSPLALDLYAWLVYRAYIVTQKDKPVFVGWNTLRNQLGCEIGRARDFKSKAKEALAKVATVYPGLRIEEINSSSRSGIRILPSRPAILPR